MCPVTGNPLCMNEKRLSCYIIMFPKFSVFMETELTFTVLILNAFTSWKDWMKFASNRTVHFWRVILLTNTSMNYLQTQSFCCFSKHQNETGYIKRPFTNACSSFMNPSAKHTQPLALLLQENNAAERSPIMSGNTSYVGVFYFSRLVFVFRNVVVVCDIAGSKG